LARFTVGSELVIDGKNMMDRTTMENKLGRHRNSRQEEHTDGIQISRVRSEHGETIVGFERT
jgi:hypothetical protein